jgi:hypothetical protein
MINVVDILQETIFYLIEKLNKKSFILTFDQFDHLILVNKLIWTCPTWLMVFLTNHMIFFWLVKSGQKKNWTVKKKPPQYLNL